MMSEGRRVDWEGLGRIQAGGTVDMGLTMKGGRRKRKTKNGNRWESLVSGGESEESDGSGRDSLDEELYAEVLEEILAKAKEEGGPMHELVEILAVLGKEERDKMLKWYEGEWYGEMMPKGISKAKRDLGILQVRWMVEKKFEESQGMMKEEAMKDGMKRGVLWRKHFVRSTWKTPRALPMGREPGESRGAVVEQLECFVRRMGELTRKTKGIEGEQMKQQNKCEEKLARRRWRRNVRGERQEW